VATGTYKACGKVESRESNLSRDKPPISGSLSQILAEVIPELADARRQFKADDAVFNETYNEERRMSNVRLMFSRFALIENPDLD
jgi:hypothetical protein